MTLSFRIYHLFYYLTAFSFLLGFLTRNVESVSLGWHSTVKIGQWNYFIPVGLSSLIIAFIYSYFNQIGKLVSNKFIIIHFSLMVIGLILLKIIIFNVDLLITNSTQFEFIIILFSGPIFLVLSIVIFIAGLIKSKSL